MKSNFYDVIIVGSGASGSAAAWNFCKSGLKVLCLEQGAAIDNNKYLMHSADNDEIHDFNYSPNMRKLKSDYPVDDDNSPIKIANYNAVGGSTVLYSGHFPRFRESDFKTKTTDNVAFDWPINYQELEPYYNLNDSIIGISGLSGDPAYPSIKNLLPPVSIGKSGELIAKAYDSLGWHWWPSYSAIINKNFKNRSKRVNQGKSTDLTYIPLAKSKGLELITKSRAIKLITDKFNNIESIVYEKSNKLNYAHASLFVLACSGLGTPRLLLNSKNNFYENGLANSSGLLGKNLMLHPLGLAEGVFDDFIESYVGPPGCCIYSHQFYDTNKINEFKRGYTMQVLRGSGPLETANSLLKFKKLSKGKKFHESFFNKYGKNIPIAIICEDLPEIHNSVELDTEHLDSSGMPGVKINYKLSDNSKRMLSHGINNAKKVLKEAGAKSILGFGPVSNTGWHIMGTAKMGSKKTDSVVDKFGKAHDFNNLVIVDSSIFPTSSAVNPVSTIQALSLKITSEIIKNKYNFSPKI